MVRNIVSETDNSIMKLEEEHGVEKIRECIKNYREEFPGKKPLYDNKPTSHFQEYLENKLNIDRRVFERRRVFITIPALLDDKINEYAETNEWRKADIVIELFNLLLNAATLLKDNGMPFGVDSIKNYVQKLLVDDMNLLITNSEFTKFTSDSFNAISNGLNQVFNRIKDLSDVSSADREMFESQEKEIKKHIHNFHTNALALWEEKEGDEIKDSPYEILVLDDDNQYHISLQNYFAGKRKIKCVSKFIDFVIFLKKEKPKIILLDILLSGERKGYEICQMLKSKKLYKDIPIIVISASAFDDIEVLKEEYKADEFYQKNEVITLEKLNKLINNYIN